MKTSSRIGAIICALIGVVFISAAVWADDATPTSTTVPSPAAPTATVAAKGTAATGTSTAPQHLPESQIPVLLSKPAQKPVAINPWGRLLLSLLIIGTVGGGMMIFARWYSTKGKKGGDLSKIRILTQFHIGPKKSLAIVRVAGEAILIGITDHNISMLKSLSLLDGELETAPEAPTHGGPLSTFQKTLAEQPVAPDAEEEDEFAIQSIKDRVSLKLKSMRPF